jgi:hypothetical protein
MVEKVGTVSAKLRALQCIFCVQDTKYKQKSNIQELLAQGRKVLDINNKCKMKDETPRVY